MKNKEADTFKDAILYLLAENPDLTKYRLAKNLGMSTPSQINNILTGVTKRPRDKVVLALYHEYGIKLRGVPQELYEGE